MKHSDVHNVVMFLFESETELIDSVVGESSVATGGTGSARTFKIQPAGLRAYGSVVVVGSVMGKRSRWRLRTRSPLIRPGKSEKALWPVCRMSS